MKIYKKEKEKIIFYPKKYDYTTLGIILTICILMIAFPVMYGLSEEDASNIEPSYIILIILFSLILLFSFLFMGNISQVIIHTYEKKIYKRNLLGEHFLASLDDIENLRFAEVLTPYMRSYVYELTYKNDKYRDGIHLTPQLRKKSKSLRKLRETILNEVELLLINNKAPFYNKTVNRRIELFGEEKPNYYVYTPPFLGRFLVASFGIAWFVLFIYLIISEDKFSLLHIVPLVVSIFFVSMFFVSTDKIVIDKNNQTLENKSLLKQLRINFSDIKRIYIYYSTGFPIGAQNPDRGSVDIFIVHYDPKKNKSYNFQIYSSSKRNKKFAQFAHELEVLLDRSIELP